MQVTDALREEFDVVPYSGDDWAQAMARNMWWLMVAMGFMLVLGALAAGTIAGLQLGDLFGGGAVDNAGRAQSTIAWATGVNFLGMGFILGGITMVLVNIVRTMRDAGADVQEAVEAAEVVKLRKPWEAQWLPHVMMAGLMVLIGAFVASLFQANELGSITASQLANAPEALSGENVERFGTAQAIGAWVGPVRFVGLATIFGSIVLALRVIIRSLRFQAFRLTELVEEAGISVTGERVPHEGNGRKESGEVSVKQAAAPTKPRRRKARSGELIEGDEAPDTGTYRCSCGDFAVFVREGTSLPQCPVGEDHHYTLSKKRASSRT